MFEGLPIGPQEKWANEASDQPQSPGWKPHFKMEGLSSLQDLLRQGDWLIKVNLNDAYLTVPMHPDHQSCLCFTIKAVDYQLLLVHIATSIKNTIVFGIIATFNTNRRRRDMTLHMTVLSTDLVETYSNSFLSFIIQHPDNTKPVHAQLYQLQT